MGKNTLIIKTLSFLIFVLFFCPVLIKPFPVFAQSYQFPTAAPKLTTPLPPIVLPPSHIKYINEYIPKTPADYQQLKILQQIQDGTLPQFNFLILNQVLHLPFLSIEIKLAVYSLLSSLPFLSSIHLSPGWLLFVTVIFPFLSLGFLIILGAIIFSLLRNTPLLLSFILFRFSKVEKNTLLELTFPSDTTKSAYATEQLYNLLHTLAKQKNFKYDGPRNLYSDLRLN